MAGSGGVLPLRPIAASFRTLGAETREDALIAGLLAVAGIVEIALGAAPEHRAAAVAGILVMAAGLVVRRRHPLVCVTVVLAALLGQSLLGVLANEQVVVIPIVIVALYSAAAHLPPAPALGALAAAVAVVAVAVTVAGPGGPDRVSDYGFGLVLVAAPWFAGRIVRRRRLAEEGAVAGAAVRARQAAEEERQRIARELHDIVSHGLSAMIVQSSAAAELVDRSPDAAKRAMEQVQATGVAAMQDMRHILGLIRAHAPGDRQPQPDLEDLSELIERERAAGLPVSLSFRGGPRDLPRGVGLSIYRIVQESLTNVRRHADASVCEVVITYAAAAVTVEVVNDGAPGAAVGEGGFGIIGMRERVRLYDGTLEAGPDAARGGWVLRATIPLEEPRDDG